MSGPGTKPDPLLAKERQAIADELTSNLRHDVRNRLSVIQNAAFYIKRRVKQTELWTTDARLQQFFGLIDESVAYSDRLLAAKLGARPADGVKAAAALALAVESARVAPGVSFDVAVDDAEVYVDALELALAVRCLLECAASGLAEPGVVRLRAASKLAGYCVEIGPWREGSSAAEADGITPGQRWEEGGDALGVHIAARVARCYGGSLEEAPASQGGSVSLLLPLEPREAPELELPSP